MVRVFAAKGKDSHFWGALQRPFAMGPVFLSGAITVGSSAAFIFYFNFLSFKKQLFIIDPVLS